MKNGKNDILYKKLFIYISIVIISCLHYLTTINIHILHDIYQRLYYIPIICAAVWFGVRYGLSTSVIISLIYSLHIIFQWKLKPTVSLQKYLEIVIFNMVALITGLLTEREQRLKNKYHELADKLKESYDKLKKQAKYMIEAEEQLRRADRLTMLGQVYAELAHEIRNPLGSIKGTVEIIKGDYTPDNKKYEFIEILVRETNRLNDVLNNVLSFTREKAPQSAQVDVNLLIRDVVNFLGVQFKKNKINVNLDLGDTVPEIELECEQLRQVIINVIINGIQAMPDGGELTIATRVDSERQNNDKMTEYLYIDFTDTGIGIPEEKVKDIFKPFYTTKDEGTGLGLSISQKIIEKFDGNILIESNLGKSTVFTIKLPYIRREKYEKEEEKYSDYR